MRETRTDTVRSPDAPAAAVALTECMSLTASARSVGDTLRQEVLVDGRHRLVTDEPKRLGGTDAGPAPHELLPAALAACIATTIRRYARTKGWGLGELSVDVVYDNKSTPRRFDVAIDLPAGLSPVQVHRLMRVAEACPLRRSIEAGMVFDEHASTPASGGLLPGATRSRPPAQRMASLATGRRDALGADPPRARHRAR